MKKKQTINTNEYTYLEHMNLFAVQGTSFVVLADSKEDASIICFMNSVPCPRKRLEEIKCLIKDCTLLEGNQDDIDRFRNNIGYRVRKRTRVTKGVYIDGETLRLPKTGIKINL